MNSSTIINFTSCYLLPGFSNLNLLSCFPLVTGNKKAPTFGTAQGIGNFETLQGCKTPVLKFETET